MAADLTQLLTSDPSDWDSPAQQWEMVYCTNGGTAVADVSNAKSRTFNFRLSQPATVSFVLTPFHPGLSEVIANPVGKIKVYKRKQLVCVFETTSIQIAGEGTERRVMVVGTEAAWVRLQKRYIGQGVDGVTYTSLDRGEIARQILAGENTRGDLGIRSGSIIPSATVTAGPWYVKQAAEAITELGNALDGFDIWFEPKEPLAAPSGVHSIMHIAPVRGGVRSNAIFEYGTGRANLRSYEWQIDNAGLINRAISIPPSYPDNVGLSLVSSADLGSAITYGLREDIVENDLVDTILRTALTNEHIAVRKQPRNLYRFQPHLDDLSGRVPAFPFDYNVGDIVTGRVNDADILSLSGLVRVYGVQVTLENEDGAEEVSLTVVEEE